MSTRKREVLVLEILEESREVVEDGSEKVGQAKSYLHFQMTWASSFCSTINLLRVEEDSGKSMDFESAGSLALGTSPTPSAYCLVSMSMLDRGLLRDPCVKVIISTLNTTHCPSRAAFSEASGPKHARQAPMKWMLTYQDASYALVTVPYMTSLFHKASPFQ